MPQPARPRPAHAVPAVGERLAPQGRLRQPSLRACNPRPGCPLAPAPQTMPGPLRYCIIDAGGRPARGRGGQAGPRRGGSTSSWARRRPPEPHGAQRYRGARDKGGGASCRPRSNGAGGAPLPLLPTQLRAAGGTEHLRRRPSSKDRAPAQRLSSTNHRCAPRGWERPAAGAGWERLGAGSAAPGGRGSRWMGAGGSGAAGASHRACRGRAGSLRRGTATCPARRAGAPPSVAQAGATGRQHRGLNAPQRFPRPRPLKERSPSRAPPLPGHGRVPDRGPGRVGALAAAQSRAWRRGPALRDGAGAALGSSGGEAPKQRHGPDGPRPQGPLPCAAAPGRAAPAPPPLRPCRRRDPAAGAGPPRLPNRPAP